MELNQNIWSARRCLSLRTPVATRAVIKRATGLNDLYCHIGAFIMTLDRPVRPSVPPASCPSILLAS